MLIRWCLGHPFVPPVSLYSLSLSLSLLLLHLFLPLTKSLSYSLFPSFTSYPFRPLIPCFAVSLAESLLFSDTKHAILVRLCNRHYYYRPRRSSVCLSNSWFLTWPKHLCPINDHLSHTMLLLISIARVIFLPTPYLPSST